MYSAHNQFPAITQTERMVDRTGNLWRKSLELLRSEKALVHRLGLCSMNKDERSSQNVAEKIGHHELQAARAEQERQILQEELLASAKGFS